jgi:hypothetical protein
VDRLFKCTAETCPQEVDIVETPLYFLIIYFSTITVSYIYKLIGCTAGTISIFMGTSMRMNEELDSNRESVSNDK